MRLVTNRVNLIFLLLLAGGAVALMLGVRPKPCPRHICLPREEVVTAEQLIAQRTKAARLAELEREDAR